MIGFFTSKIRVTFKCKSTAQGKMYWPIKDEGLVRVWFGGMRFVEIGGVLRMLYVLERVDLLSLVHARA